MKFGHELLALEESCPKEFSGRFLKYKELKKLIKRIREMEAEGSTDSPEEREFLTLLNAEVASVNRTFEQHAQQVVHAAARKRRPRRSCCLPSIRKSSGGLKEEELAQHAQWCRRFATVNATGLRKIAKKHDKYARNSAGQQFLKVCWDCRNKELGAFLHSPLIDELRALEALSEAHRTTDAADFSGSRPAAAAVAAPPPSAPAAAAPPQPQGSEHDASMEDAAAALHSESRRSLRLPHSASLHVGSCSDDDNSPRSGDSAESSSFRCAICLAPMWMPVGLSCGHIFCTECVFHAVGITSWVRPLHEVLADVPPTATCPKCRQRYVFREVLELKELGAVIRFKYPYEVGQRAAEVAEDMEAKRKEKKRVAAAKRRSRLSELMEPFPRGL